jgi:hypothetical protein
LLSETPLDLLFTKALLISSCIQLLTQDYLKQCEQSANEHQLYNDTYAELIESLELIQSQLQNSDPGNDVAAQQLVSISSSFLVARA